MNYRFDKGFPHRTSRYVGRDFFDYPWFHVRPVNILLERIYEKYETELFIPDQVVSMVEYLQGYKIIEPDGDAQKYADDFIIYWEDREYLTVHRSEDRKETK